LKFQGGFYNFLQLSFAYLNASRLLAITIDIKKFISLNTCGDILSFLISASIAGTRTAVLTAKILGTEGDSPRKGLSSLTQSYLRPRYVV
jgi:hypothetical protein